MHSSTQTSSRLTTPGRSPQCQKLRQRVSYLSKEELKTKKATQETYNRLLKVIENKLNHEQAQMNRLNLLKKRENDISHNHEKVKMMRQKQQQQLRNVKQSYLQQKRDESATIKQMKENIRQMSIQLKLQQKQRHSDLVTTIKEGKETLKMVRLKTQSERKAYVQKIHKEKEIQQQNKKKQTELMMKELEKKQQELINRLGTSQNYQQNLQKLTEKMSKLSIQDFNSLLGDLKDKGLKTLAQNILKKQGVYSP